MIIKHRCTRSASGASYGASTLLIVLLAVFVLFNQTAVFAYHEEEVKVGVVVNTEAVLGKIALTAMNMSLADFYSGTGAKYNTRIVLHVRDSPNNDVVAFADAVLSLIKNEQVHAIIGPETSEEAHFIIKLGEKAQVPIISYSASSPHLHFEGSYFIQATQNDSAQVPAITSIIQAFMWRQVVPIYTDDEFGGGVIPHLTDALQQIGTRIPYKSVITSSFTDDQLEAELYKLKSMETRVFIVHMKPSIGMRIFSKAKEIEMLSRDYVWIVTNWIGNVVDDLNLHELHSMQGVIGTRAWIKDTKRVQDFNVRWKRNFMRENPGQLHYPEMNVYGLWAYDTVEALAKAVEEVGVRSNFTFHKQATNEGGSSGSPSTDMSSLEKSRVGPKLLMELKGTKFDGLSGEFNLINEQLQSSTQEIINIDSDGKKIVGFWTLKDGLVKELASTTNKRSSIPKQSLASIRWPGDQEMPPKGWVLPVNNLKKLRVLVPVRSGKFISISKRQPTKNEDFTGYSIEIFNEVMMSLPYPVPYEYVARPTPGSNVTETYEELIDEVFRQEADVFVADTTITMNRSFYVDFTVPYTQSGMKMLVPIKDDDAKKAWIFIKPLSWELWVAILFFFIFIGFAVWVLEHRVNPQFRGPPEYQVGTSLYFSFSTMVFSHNNHIFSNLARLVMVVWIFVVLILIQSYTASLTTMLTVKQLEPTFTDIKDLLKEKKFVGYQQGSFVKGELLGMGFEEEHLRAFRGSAGMYQLFSNGTENGGISAAFDEIPYLSVFLADHCNEYMMVPPIYKTAGFGFAFSKGTPLMDDVSRAVLNVTEGKKIVEIEKRWFGNMENCLNPSSQTPKYNSLKFKYFWALFSIAGFVAVFALVIHIVRFLYQHKHVWRHSPDAAATTLKNLARLFDEKNAESHHTFNTGCPPSPVVMLSDHTNRSTFNSPAVTTSPEHRSTINTPPSLEHRRPHHQNEEVVVLEISDV